MTNNVPLNALTVIFEHQHTDDSCGAACAEMVLKMIGIRHLDQDTLMEEINAFTTEDQGNGSEDWAASPDGLQDVLNTHSQPNHFFTLEAKHSQAAILKKMVMTIFHYKTPCITLIKSGFHWVVVYDYKLKDNAPANLNGLSVNHIDGFYFLDPFNNVPSEGMVGIHAWEDKIQFPETKGLWGNKYVALCDPEPPDDKKGKNMFSKKKKTFGKASQDSFNEAKTPNVNKPDDPSKIEKPKESKLKNANPEQVPNDEPPITRIKKTGPDRGLIDDETAGAYSEWHLEHDGFYIREKFTRTMVNPGAGKPMLVRALDTEDFWYIVPFLEMNKQMGVMRVNAKNGAFLEAAFAMHKGQPLKLTTLSDAQITKILIDEYGKPNGKIVIDHQILVWKPCVQSYSGFLPFYRVKWGTKTKYVRIDGEPFSSLTQRRHGKT